MQTTDTPRFAPGDQVRIVLRYPEDEGFAKRCLDGQIGVIMGGAKLPGDTRECVLFSGGTRALVDPRELQRA